MLIVIEGPDGSGKSTVGKALARVLSADLIEFPCDEGYTGPLIRSYLRKEWWTQVETEEDRVSETDNALVFQALQIANRMEFMQRIYDAENMVLVRYWQSGFVYGSLDGLNEAWLRTTPQTMRRADLNILLDLDAETSLARQVKRGDDPERYEGNREFTEKVVGKYRELWGKYPDGPLWRTVDASQDLQDVIADVLRYVIEDIRA